MTVAKHNELRRPPTPLAGIAVGDAVVYASHGIGRVTRRDAGSAQQAECVTLEFDGGLSVTLPVERALWCLRAPCGEKELAKVQRTLRAPASACDESWRVRMKDNTAKVAAGAAVELAEIVRDGANRQPKVNSRGDVKELSLAERQLYLQARKLLVDEVAEARGVASDDADAWITVQLSRPSASAAASGAPESA